MKPLHQRLLAWGARRTLRRAHPKVVAVTGSVGKTGTKDAIAAVLGGATVLRKSSGNYNNELGVPLTILDRPAPGRSARSWFGILLAAIRAGERPYPKTLVLEMAADHPGDIAYLATLAPPDIAVLTRIAPVHIEFFGSLEAIAHEKGWIVQRLRPGGTAVLNRDDPLVWRQRKRTHERILSYGTHPEADVRLEHLEYRGVLHAQNPFKRFGLHSILSYQDRVQSVSLPGIIGPQLMTGVLAAVGAGVASGLSLEEIADALLMYESPPGRMRLLPGIKRTTLLDDSYNASPAAVIAALDVLAAIPVSGKRIAVLGDMEELGTLTETEHRRVGAHARRRADMVVTVGEKSRLIAEAARETGLQDEAVFTFADRHAAGRFVQERLREEYAVLVKGSQAARMESVVKELMAEPERAAELLVRQGPGWQ